LRPARVSACEDYNAVSRRGSVSIGLQ